MRFALPSFLIMALICASCASTPNAPQGYDARYGDAVALGTAAFQLGNLKEAARNYAKAYAYALKQDNAKELASAGFDLGITFLAMDTPRDASLVISRVKTDLMMRGKNVPQSFLILDAASLYRQGDAANAARIACALNGSSLSQAERAWFICGHAAAKIWDSAQLSMAQQRLCRIAPQHLLWRADCEELSLQEALNQKRWSQAYAHASSLIAMRRTLNDSRGLQHALLLASQAARGMGDAVQAENFLLRYQQSLSSTSSNILSLSLQT